MKCPKCQKSFSGKDDAFCSICGVRLKPDEDPISNELQAAPNFVDESRVSHGEVNEYAAANALQNPTVLDQGGNQKATEDPSAEVLDTTEGSPTSNIESAPESPPRNVSAETEEAGDATEKDCPDKTTLESVSLLKAAAPPDLYGETGENSVELTNGDSTATSNNESDVPQACVKDDGQPEVDNDQGDSENDSDSEKKATGTHKTSKNDTKSASQRKREAKKERKSRREAEKKQQALSKREGAMNESPADQKNVKTKQNQVDDNPSKSDIKKNNGQNASSVGVVKENSKVEDKGNGYFRRNQGKKMTVVFHAVLAPHFKFEKNKGDRIYMRFGGAAFGGFQDNVVEVFPERYLEGDFILVKAELLVPLDHLPPKVPYKYIVVKPKESTDKKHLWEHLLDFGHMKNRCLQIPRDRCYEGAVWHQYDDTIFSPPSFWQSIRSKLPFGTDSAEGRKIATRVMLPKWEGFTMNDVEENITAWEAVQKVNDIAYCFTQTEAIESGRTTKNVPHRYNFQQILKEFFKTRIETNDVPQPVTEDKETFHPLVSSVAIAYVIYTHKVCLDPQQYAKLFASLIPRSDPRGKRCTGFEKILEEFPGDQLQSLGEAIQAICKHVAKNHLDLHDWLFAVPLVHFLTKVSQPFSNSVLLMEKPKEKDDTWWGANGFDTKSVRERNFTEYSCPSTLIKLLSPLFELDPLFRRTFLLVVPLRVFGKIASSGKFALVEVYTTLARTLSEKGFIHEEERNAVTASLNVILEDAKKTSKSVATGCSTPEELITLTQQAYLCNTSCLRILHVLVSSRCNFDLLHSCVLNIETWFLVLEMIEQEEKRKFDKLKRVVVETFEVVNTVLKKHVLSSKMPWYSTTETEEELRIWSLLLDIVWKNNECAESWKNNLSRTLKMRLEELDCNNLVKIFTKANMVDQHNHVQDLVSKVTFRKVEGMLKGGNEGEEVFRNLTEYAL